MTNILGLASDATLAVLLIVTIGYCARLSRRIRAMQESRGELANLIARFDQATARAVSTLAELQATTKRITEALQLKIEKANFLADDLAFLIEKSAKLSAQLEQKSKAAKAPPASASPAPPAVKLKPASSWEPSSAAAPSLEALLSRLASPGGQAPSVTPKPERPPSARTGAERELLEALKAGR